MADEPRPSNRRLGRAAVGVLAILAAIIIVIFVTYNISHYRQMKAEQAGNGTAVPNGAMAMP